MTPTANHASTDRASETRARILDAALGEFSTHGLAGARTDRIANSAGVNKALLYYYFESKENLYLAAFEMISAKIRDRSLAVFLRESSPGERVLRSALEHFDRILTQHEFQALMQQEMIRMHNGEEGALPVLVKRVFAPLMTMYESMVREGIESGELIHTDWMQIHLATLGANVFYFLTGPVRRILYDVEPFSQEALAQRRVALVEFLGQAIFADRQRGAELAARVLADTPMPEVNTDRLNFGRKDERA
ncbi:MAG: TetR/AcrR family transcriptional regulator [Terracidiphilus sp.]